MSTALESYAKQRLHEMGWPEDVEVRYDVSFCQGSGTSFLVDLNTDALMRRYRHSLSDLKGIKRVRELRRSNDIRARMELVDEICDFSVNIKCDRGFRYVHESSVDVELNDYFSADIVATTLEERAEAGDTSPWDEVTDDEWYDWATEWRDQVKEWHEQDARSVHRELENIVMSCYHETCGPDTIWEFKTRKFHVELLKHSADVDDLDFYDVDLSPLADGTSEFCQLVCKIHLIDEDGLPDEELVLAVRNLLYSKKGEKEEIRSVRNDLIGEAIEEVRQYLDRNEALAA